MKLKILFFCTRMCCSHKHVNNSMGSEQCSKQARLLTWRTFSKIIYMATLSSQYLKTQMFEIGLDKNRRVAIHLVSHANRACETYKLSCCFRTPRNVDLPGDQDSRHHGYNATKRTCSFNTAFRFLVARLSLWLKYGEQFTCPE